ncbi:hypothetical protein ACH3XW_18460 [Acanthocheilonema viteae]
MDSFEVTSGFNMTGKYTEGVEADTVGEHDVVEVLGVVAALVPSDVVAIVVLVSVLVGSKPCFHFNLVRILLCAGFRFTSISSNSVLSLSLSCFVCFL